MDMNINQEPNPNIASSVLEEPGLANFLQMRNIKEADFSLIEELATYPTDVIVEHLHNVFNMNHERAGDDLDRDMSTARHEKYRRLFEIFKQLFSSYDWATCYHLVRTLENRDGAPSIYTWKRAHGI